jgi:hypothetical protein
MYYEETLDLICSNVLPGFLEAGVANTKVTLYQIKFHSCIFSD